MFLKGRRQLCTLSLSPICQNPWRRLHHTRRRIYDTCRHVGQGSWSVSASSLAKFVARGSILTPLSQTSYYKNCAPVSTSTKSKALVGPLRMPQFGGHKSLLRNSHPFPHNSRFIPSLGPLKLLHSYIPLPHTMLRPQLRRRPLRRPLVDRMAWLIESVLRLTPPWLPRKP